jgi:hypothetical protein
MTDNPLRSELNNLERKLILLINDHKKVKGNLDILKKENIELKEMIRQKEANMADFQNKDNVSKIVSNMVEENEETTELVEVINDYIKEVDKCIAQLSE